MWLTQCRLVTLRRLHRQYRFHRQYRLHWSLQWTASVVGVRGANMQSLELVILLIVAGVTASVLVMAARPIGKARFLFLLIPLFAVVSSVMWVPADQIQQEILQQIPTIGRAEYVGSGECRSCHPSQHASWHDTYHRTMTQLPSQQSVLAPFDGRVLESAGVSCAVHQEGDIYFVDMPDPDWEAAEYPNGIEKGEPTNAPRVRLPVVMLTGSHHLQAYWVPSEHGNKLRIFPYVYHVGMQRWLPVGDSFINPPDSKRYPQIWNNNCIQCHGVAGETGYEPNNWQTSVAELGISCEACHGPGESHVAKHNNPLSRYATRLAGQPDPTIVHPGRLSAKQSAEVCGQCHTAFDPSVDTPKNVFRPGDNFHNIFSLAGGASDPSFWPDGTMRIGGREFSGLSQSACYLKGEMSCLSCHSMHSSDPDKQMSPAKLSDHGCTQCHADKGGDGIEAHTHHAADSPGSRCYNCHMPFSSYALFKAIRSHRIDSPSVAMSTEHGRPNACNQCHVDQTLGWTSQHLQSWYGIESVTLTEDQANLSATLLWMLKGDAVQRVIATWTLGWEPTRQAAGDGWQPHFLSPLLQDPYSMTRFMAHDSLKKLGVEIQDFDFLAPPMDRPGVSLQRLFNANLASPPNAPGVQIFFNRDGTLNQEMMERFLRQRDDTPVTLTE